MVNAWFQTGAFGVADLIYVIDQDDMEFKAYEADLHHRPEVTTVTMPEWKPLVPKLNQVADLVSQNYNAVGFLGDDHLPRTPMWAHQLVAQHAMSNKPRIVYGQDGFQDRRLCTWWSMDSRIIRALNGRMVPADVQHLYCDNSIMVLGNEAGCLTYLESVLIEHMHPIAGKADTDAQYQRVNRRQQYVRDETAFHAWLKDGLERDAKILASLGG
jgi:hypothetical protein